MPKRTDIKKILIIGAGPIVIGQACEFDYSGTQACKALKEEGYEVVLINSNPATIMTDPGLADMTYIEPVIPNRRHIIAAYGCRHRRRRQGYYNAVYILCHNRLYCAAECSSGFC